jgi:hydrogenase maturation protease
MHYACKTDYNSCSTVPVPYAIRCLILACGNTLRSDDGVGRKLAEWAEKRFRDEPGVRVISVHQWTPEFSEDVAAARFVIFIDCSIATPAGFIEMSSVTPEAKAASIDHHLSPQELLTLADEFYNALPLDAQLLTIGAGSVSLGEGLSDEVLAALPHAITLLESTVLQSLANEVKP